MRTENIAIPLEYLPDWIVSEVLSYTKNMKGSKAKVTSNTGKLRIPRMLINSNTYDLKASNERVLEKIQTVLDEKLVESSFSIADFSKAVGMSRMQLHRKIKAITGLSAGDFIRSQRLKLAADLLKKSDITISEIGYMVGFNDHSYFTKCFKEAYGATPTAFAKERT